MKSALLDSKDARQISICIVLAITWREQIDTMFDGIAASVRLSATFHINKIQLQTTNRIITKALGLFFAQKNEIW